MNYFRFLLLQVIVSFLILSGCISSVDTANGETLNVNFHLIDLITGQYRGGEIVLDGTIYYVPSGKHTINNLVIGSSHTFTASMANTHSEWTLIREYEPVIGRNIDYTDKEKISATIVVSPGDGVSLNIYVYKIHNEVDMEWVGMYLTGLGLKEGDMNIVYTIEYKDGDIPETIVDKMIAEVKELQTHRGVGTLLERGIFNVPRIRFNKTELPDLSRAEIYFRDIPEDGLGNYTNINGTTVTKIGVILTGRDKDSYAVQDIEEFIESMVGKELGHLVSQSKYDLLYIPDPNIRSNFEFNIELQDLLHIYCQFNDIGAKF